MAEFLELVLPIVDEDSRATPYFEDYLFQIIQGLGGEGSNTITTAVVNAEDAARIPYMVGYINRLAKRIQTLEGDLSFYKVAHQVAQLQVDTAGFVNKTALTTYTAKHNEWVEAFNRAPITLPANPLRNQRVRVTNGDGSFIQVGSVNPLQFKIRGVLESCAILRTAGNSYDFQWFGDYWLVA